jgi:hypothetical protein
MTNTRLLELWGETLLEAARVSKGSQAFFDIFQNGYASKPERAGQAYRRFAELCRDAFGKDGIETFNTVMQDFYRNVGVVPRKQYNDLKEEHERLQERVRDLEDKLLELRNRLDGGGATTEDLMGQWIDLARKYADMNQKFLEEFGKMFSVNPPPDSQE